MKKVSVDHSIPSYYHESDSKFHRFKRKLTLLPILRIIKKYLSIKEKFSLLEVGSGSGFLISFLEEEFPHAKLTGLEYDERLVPVIRSKVNNAKIIQGNAEDFTIEGQEFDIAVSLQAIEHLYQPVQMIKCIKKHLKKDGLLIFTTPNPKSLAARIMKEKWHGYRDDHVSMKSLDEWKAITEQEGFKTVYCGTTFFTGIPWMNRLPFGIINWLLLLTFGSLPWNHGESFVGVFKNV